MGNQYQPGPALVSMTNGDVYHISMEDARDILDDSRQPKPPLFHYVTEVRMGVSIRLAAAHISSIVFQESRNAQQ